MADVNKLKTELLKQMPEKDAKHISNIFKEFTKETTSRETIGRIRKCEMGRNEYFTLTFQFQRNPFRSQLLFPNSR